MTTADASLDAQDLAGRVSQGALVYRTAQYAYATAWARPRRRPWTFTPASLPITNFRLVAARDLQHFRVSSTALPVLQVYMQDSACSGYQPTNYARLWAAP